jgi:ATP-dependent Clp protease protease subunit
MRDRLHEVLLSERVILLDAPITDEVANIAIAKLLFLDSENPTTRAHLLLNTPGGHVSAALAIRDTIDDVSCPVHVHALKQVAGVAVLLLAHGVRGARVASPSTVVQLTAISSPDGTASPSELERIEKIVAEMLASDTGQAFDTILKDMREMRSFAANDAREYGFVDRIADPTWPAVRKQSTKIN